MKIESIESELIENETEEIPLVIGSKVGVTVITNEAIGVPTVSENIVHNKQKPYVYKLTNKGYVNKEYVSTGLWTDQKVEIIDESAVGNLFLFLHRRCLKTIQRLLHRFKLTRSSFLLIIHLQHVRNGVIS